MGAQTDLTSASFCGMHKQIDDRQRVIDGLTVETCTESGGFQWRTPAYDEIMKFYTGLPSIKVLKAVVRLVNKACPILLPWQAFRHFKSSCYNSKALPKLSGTSSCILSKRIMCYTVSQMFLKCMYDSNGQTRMHAHLMAWSWSIMEDYARMLHVSNLVGTKVAVIIDFLKHNPIQIYNRKYNPPQV